ncbi:MAG: SDR family NAD(P)-dependent oxidoreductase [Caulobacter sp.]|nr:SDR family NAD(P)-dependent oxidoreductase [Caulobacter sp.]
MLDLKDVVAVVSGAGSGIGRAMAEACARRGAVVAVIDIDLDGAEETAVGIRAAGGRATAYQGDVTDLAALQVLAERVETELGGVNITFNNAGVFTAGPLDRTRPNDFDWVFEVNVRGVYNAVVSWLPALRRSAAAGKLAHIVNTGSENSIAVPTMGPFSAYTATKHAVLGMTECLRRDLKGNGVNVSIVCPGVVSTNLWNAKRARPDRFGGAKVAQATASDALDAGRSPEDTVQTLFEGLDQGEFLIVTDPRIRAFTEPRLAEVAAALDICDTRVKL